MKIIDRIEGGRTTFFLLLIVLLFSFFYLSYRINLNEKEFPFAKKGVLNYQSLAFSENGKLLLKGEWEFYWQKLYFPSDFKAANEYPLSEREFTSFPASWNRITTRGEASQTKSSYGYATYRLKITGLSPGEKYALLVPVINSSYTLWINGERMLNSGLTGVESELSMAAANPRTVAFSAKTGEIFIVLHISNYTHHRGGPLQHILIGRDDEVSSADALEIIFSGMGIISSLMVVVFLLFLDLRYRKYHKEIFSILLFTALAMRISVSDSLLMLRLFPDLSWEIVQKLRYIFTYCLGPLVMLVLTENDIKRRRSLPVFVFSGTFLLLILSVLIFPAGKYTELYLLFDIHQILCFVYTGFVLADHVGRKEPLYTIHSFGTGLFVLLFINMRLFMLGILVADEVSLSVLLNIFINDQFSTQSGTPSLIFFSFFPYFFIFCFYLFSKIDNLILYLKDEKVTRTIGSPELFEKYKLTEREIEILKAVIKGNSNLEIAEKCFISVGTVKNHLSHIYRKTNCSNRNKLNKLFNGHDRM